MAKKKRSVKKKRRRLRRQVTCRCRAYDFPHRIGGGECSGSDWAESYFLYVTEGCERCNCRRDDGSCDVATGLENIAYCEGFIGELHWQTGLRLPIDNEEEYINYLYGSQYGEEPD